MKIACLNTPLGIAEITGNIDGISGISISKSEEIITDVIPKNLVDCVYQLQEYFEGKRQTFHLNLNPQGTEFQKKVWKQLQHIPYGKSISYLELSKQLGDSKAIRAAGGLERKQWLLNHENPYKQQALF